MNQKRCTKKWTAAKRRRQSMTASESRYRADKTERPGGDSSQIFCNLLGTGWDAVRGNDGDSIPSQSCIADSPWHV